MSSVISQFINYMQLSQADIVGFLLSAASAVVALVACYHLYKVSKILGGLLGEAFRKIALGIVFNLFAMAFIGLAFGPLNISDSMVVAIVGPAAWITGNLFIVNGLRFVTKAVKS